MKYRVYFEHREQASMDVDASSQQEAIDKAQELHSQDEGNMTEWDASGCDIIDCEKLSDAA